MTILPPPTPPVGPDGSNPASPSDDSPEKQGASYYCAAGCAEQRAEIQNTLEIIQQLVDRVQGQIQRLGCCQASADDSDI